MQPASAGRGRPGAPGSARAGGEVTGHEVTSGEVTGAGVPGGTLAVEVFRRDTEPVLAIHGISSQRRLWNWLRAARPDLSLIAPDLSPPGARACAGLIPEALA